MSNLIRVLLALALLWLGYLCWHAAHLRPSPTEGEMDGSKLLLLFGGVVACGLIVGGLIVTMLLPKLGEQVGNFFFSPNEQAERHPHEAAITARARGDYAGSVAAYRKIIQQNPEDTLALAEAARVLCEKLHDCEGAAQLLEDSLGREWHAEDAAFLSLRLYEVYWTHQHDAPRARQLLLQVMETVPDSKQATTAAHKLHELDRKLMMQG